MTHNIEKEKRYVGLLDAARCKGNWADVPERVRKVSKHAPHRTCLVLTANTELLAVKRFRRISNSKSRPSTSQNSELAQLIPPLLRAIETRSQPTEDIFQCRACLAWLHWLRSEPALAASRLPEDIVASFSEISETTSLPSDYTILCMLRSVYIKGHCYEEENNKTGSLEVFVSAVPWMHTHQSKLLSQPYLLSISEQLRAHTALTARDALDLRSPGSDRVIDIALQAFRHWAILSARSKDWGADDFGIVESQTRQKIEIWKAYYFFLSKLLRKGIDHHVRGEKHTRLHQVAELRRVESTYGAQLLRNTAFPRANESNKLVDDWVEQITENWKILCARSWPEADLGEGGRNAVGRNVLDLLYQAATKTFHSTRILRRLFQVHKSVADFHLAYRAFESYVDLTTGCKKRTSNSQEAWIGIDDKQTVWKTVAEGIEGLCMSGREAEAEKAFDLALKLSEWIKTYTFENKDCQDESHVGSNSDTNEVETERGDGRTLEIVHRAIGVGTAFWAAWTPESERRSRYQEQALASFNYATARATRSKIQPSVETAYAQAFLLAETRDLKEAIKTAKAPLSNSGLQVAENDLAGQRKLIPLWHLLALLLSSRRDFQEAHQICHILLDQFTELDLAVGSAAASSTGSSDVNEKKVPINGEPHGLCDDMSGREKETLIEIKMTELALLEILKGVEEAVNGSHEMLGLCSMFSNQLGTHGQERPKAERLVSPPSAAGTVRGFRDKFFGRRPHHAEASYQQVQTQETSSPLRNEDLWDSAHAAEAPTIQVTDEDSRMGKTKSLRFRRSHSQLRSDSGRRKLHKKSAPDMNRKWNNNRFTASRPASGIFSSQRPSFESEQGQFGESEAAPDSVSDSSPRERSLLEPNGSTTSEKVLASRTSPLAGDRNSVQAAKPSLPLISHNIADKEMPPPAGYDEQPPQQELRLPTVHTAASSTQAFRSFPRVAEQLHAHSVLVKVWLFIAGLYRRASLGQDSREACDEASKSAAHSEALVAAQESSAAVFADPGWEGGRSPNQLQADVHVERAYLAVTEGSPNEALQHFEEALMYSMDDAKATVGLCNLLLDIYEEKIPLEPPQVASPRNYPLGTKEPNGCIPSPDGEGPRKIPDHQNRLAARDRAYGLLSQLTKRGSSWDDSEAWFALARAYQCSEQADKERDALQWCLELEETRPVRHWRNINPGSYVL